MAKQKNVFSKNLCSTSFPKGSYFFVYGTLKSRFKNEFAQSLFHQSVFLGEYYTKGKLFLIQWYPGALFQTKDRSIIVGELYFKKGNAFHLKTKLDKYEGIDYSYNRDEYIIKKIKCKNSIKILEALTYEINTNIPFSNKNNFKKRYVF